MPNHKRGRVARVIRTIVLLHLSAGAASLLACGGKTDLVPLEGDGGVPQGGVCAVTSTSSLSAGCGEYSFPLTGSAAACDADDAGQIPKANCQALCPPYPPQPSRPVLQCTMTTCVECGAGYTDIPEIDCIYEVICGTGRRPRGLRPCRPRRARSIVGAHLARVAYLEAASVDAFERLERELRAHGAPRHLRAGARAARRDEVRHARVTKALAERAGGVVASPRVRPGPVRDLEAIALENAVEGCVREAFGAAVAVVQAERAGDASVRAEMRGIARDELRHAELSFRVARWLDTKLDAGARARVRRASAKAARDLVRSLEREPPPALVAALGVPDARRARAIAGELRAALWS